MGDEEGKGIETDGEEEEIDAKGNNTSNKDPLLNMGSSPSRKNRNSVVSSIEGDDVERVSRTFTEHTLRAAHDSNNVKSRSSNSTYLDEDEDFKRSRSLQRCLWMCHR